MNRLVGYGGVLAGRQGLLLGRAVVTTCRIRVCYHTEHGIYGDIPRKPAQRYDCEPDVKANRIRQSDLWQLVQAYRQHGHLKAQTDPLGLVKPRIVEELEPTLYGLEGGSRELDLHGILHSGPRSATLEEVVSHLEQTYCGPLTAEFSHLPSLREREWFAEKYEQIQSEQLTGEEQSRLAKLMLRSQVFDKFLASKFQSVKRYGGEGAESAMGFYEHLLRTAANYDIHDVMICIAHRGRLNLLTCLLNYPVVAMLCKMRGKSEFPADVVGSGDVLSHLTSSTDLDYGDRSVHVTMLPNPSHLEAVNPMAVGKTRGREQTLRAGSYASDTENARPGDKVLCLQIHGDGAFSGQGIISETFAIAECPNYTIGGSVHLVINNQLGYTAEAARGRSGIYCSDMAKINGCPVIHVNGDCPEEVVKASRLAMAYREEFRRDVVVDMVCYRRWGHNELDEPAFTQPIMYHVIRNRASVPDTYAGKVKEQGVCTAEELEDTVSQWSAELSDHLKEIDTYIPKAQHLAGSWKGFIQAPSQVSSWDTGVDTDLLKFVGSKSVQGPDDMIVHSTLQKTHIERRLQRMETGTELDWATAEALAFGSLLYQGYNVRISGQDVGRGTFSQRHAMFVDQQTDATTIPLNHMVPEQSAFVEVCNSALSEEAVLGFEYGVSIENPGTLVIWEAQFGDFFNGAQIIIDTLVTGGETKWLLQSGLVMLLPHGMDGAGPEHSSCKIERFLQLTDSQEDGIDGDDVNMFVVNPTTPAQFFHILRRQMVRSFRKPLMVAAPKMLLRHPACTSTLSDMAPGTTFYPVLGDPLVDPTKVTKVVLVSGKHYYTLSKEREERSAHNTALIRLEELCPFPAENIRNELAKFPNATDFVWSQEEHRNMGAWSFVSSRMENVLGRKVRYVGRGVHATPAVGIGEVHQREAKQLIDSTFT